MNRKTVLAIFAHPDDDELVCLGTLARLVKMEYRVCVLELSKGENTNSISSAERLSESSLAAQLVGYEIYFESLQDGYMQYDSTTIGIVEKYLREFLPDLVITHFPQRNGLGHQDHDTVADAVVNATRRSGQTSWVLYGEPPTHSRNFNPNLFVEITPFLKLKKRAIEIHASEKNKTYMAPDIAETKSKWWSMQVHSNDFVDDRHYEAFQIVKGVCRIDNTSIQDLTQLIP